MKKMNTIIMSIAVACMFQILALYEGTKESPRWTLVSHTASKLRASSDYPLSCVFPIVMDLPTRFIDPFHIAGSVVAYPFGMSALVSGVCATLAEAAAFLMSVLVVLPLSICTLTTTDAIRNLQWSVISVSDLELVLCFDIFVFMITYMCFHVVMKYP